MFEHIAERPEHYRPNFTKLSIILDDVNVNESSISYLFNLWEAMKRVCQLPDLFSVLANIEEGKQIGGKPNAL